MRDILTKGLVFRSRKHAYTLTLRVGHDRDRANCERVQARGNSLGNVLHWSAVSLHACLFLSLSGPLYHPYLNTECLKILSTKGPTTNNNKNTFLAYPTFGG